MGQAGAASVANAAIHENIFRSGNTELIVSYEELNDIMKIVKSLEEFGLLIRGLRKTIKNESKEQKRQFLGMLLGTLDASLLQNLLTGKSKIRAGQDF